MKNDERKLNVGQLIDKIYFLVQITGNDEEARLRAEGAFSVLYWLDMITKDEYDLLLKMNENFKGKKA